MNEIDQIGVVFDLDGVLIDSHDQHLEAWCRLACEIGKEISDEQFARSFGMRNEMCIPHVFEWAAPYDRELIMDLGNRKEVIYREILGNESMAPLPGVLEFTKMLRKAGIPGSVGSSTSVLNIKLCLQATGLDQFFGPHITGAEDVSQGKPAPDVFLEAARKIKKLPAHCLVIEDAHVGVEAGLAAGMKVLAVTTTHAANTFGGKPHRIVDCLSEIKIQDLLDFFKD